MTAPTTPDIIQNLLHNIGTPRETALYLSLLRRGKDTPGVLIKVGGAILRDQLDELVGALAFLAGVGVTPVVVHGGGPQLDEALEEAGVQSHRVDGQRATTPEVLAVARRVFHAEGERLAERLERAGVRARPIISGLVEAEPLDPERLGLVGRAVGLRPDSMLAAWRSGVVPIIPSLGETPGGQILNVNADAVAAMLVHRLAIPKVVFLTGTGGLLDAEGKRVPAVNLAEDYDRLLGDGVVTGGMAVKLREIKAMLDAHPGECSVSIASPDHLARELLTHRGDGTLVRKGVTISEMRELDAGDRESLRRLVESSFGRTLKEDYFTVTPISRVLVSSDRNAAAILIETEHATYLDKFAVTPEAQGAGVGASLWRRITESAPRLFWRCRTDNPILRWYFERADGMARHGNWIVFWRGMENRREIDRCVRWSLALEPSFLSPAEATVGV